MPPRFFNDPPRPQEVTTPAFTRLLFIAFGVAALIGLVTGSIWIAWKLFELHVLR